MQIGIDSFGAVISEPATGLTLSPVQRMENLLEEIGLADQVGLDVFGVGEHHRSEFVDSAPVVILGAAAARTKKYSPDKRRNRSQRGGSRPHLSGIRHAGPDLPWACRDRCRTRFVNRGLSALRFRSGRLRLALLREAGSSAQDSRGRAY